MQNTSLTRKLNIEIHIDAMYVMKRAHVANSPDSLQHEWFLFPDLSQPQGVSK